MGLSVIYGQAPAVLSEREPNLLGSLNQPEFDRLPDPKYNMCYWAPELGILEEINHPCKSFDWKKCDIWSIGCVLADMLRGGEPLFTAKTARNHISEILRIKECRPKQGLAYLHDPDFPLIVRWPDKGTTSLKDLVNYIPPSIAATKKKPSLYNTQSTTLPEKCIDFLSKLLAFNPEDRPSCDELLQHEFFNEMERKSSVETQCTFGDQLTDNNLLEFVFSKCGGP